MKSIHPSQRKTLAILAGLTLTLLPSLHAASYVTEVSADNPLSWYRFSETPLTNTSYTDSGSGANNGTGNIVRGTGAGGFTTNGGDSLGQYAADTSATSVSLGNTNATSSILSDLNGTSGISVEFWIDFSSVTTAGNVLFIPTSGNSAALSVRATSSGVAVGGRSQDTGDSFVERSNFSLSGKTHIVFTIDYSVTGGAFKLYANGVDTSLFANANSFGSTTFNISTSANPSTIGTAAGATTNLAANFDEVAIYRSVLSQSRVQAHYNAVPEPSTAMMLVLGLLGVVGIRRRRTS